MIKVKLTYYAFEIFIDNILHLRIKREEIETIQSWTNGNIYYIQYSLKSGKDIITEYSSKECWKFILDSITKINIW